MIRPTRSIRSKLLAFVGALIACSTLASALLVYNYSRDLLEPRLTAQLADTVAYFKADIEGSLRVHGQNLNTWARLGLMRELVVTDIDKTVSAFLLQLQTDYDSYAEISAYGRDGVCIASSSPARIGIRDPRAAVIGTANHIDVETVSADDGTLSVVLAATIPDPDQERTQIGSLRAVLHPRVFASFVAPRSEHRGISVRLADGGGHTIAGRLAPPDVAAFVESAAIELGSGPAWRITAAMPREMVAAPIRALRNRVFAIGAAVTLLGLVLAALLSASLTRPINELTLTTSRIASTGVLEAIPATLSTDEVGDLTRSFQTMVDNLSAAREKLVQSAKLALLGEMSAGLAHEVRTPLGIVRNAAQLLQRRMQRSGDKEGVEFAGFICEETDRLNAVVTDMLDVARPAATEKSPTDTIAVVERAAAFLESHAETAGVRVLTQAESPVAEIIADGNQVYQAVLNLLLNAIQACRRDGVVTVRIRNHQDGVEVQIRDTGCGIPEELCDHLFAPFTTRRDGGIGLGLAIVARIVEAHSGTVTAAAGDHGGSVFTMWLPTGKASEHGAAK